MTITGIVSGIPDAGRPWVRVRTGDNPDDLTALDPAPTDADGNSPSPTHAPAIIGCKRCTTPEAS